VWTDLVEQLIKGTANNCRLDMKIAGCKKKTYMFDDVRQRENFCQLVQQLKNMHSLDPEVKRISIFVGTWNMGTTMSDFDSLSLLFYPLLLSSRLLLTVPRTDTSFGLHRFSVAVP